MMKTTVKILGVVGILALSVITPTEARDTSKEIDVSGFTKVTLKGSMDVEIKVGEAASLVVEGDEKQIRYFLAEVKSGDLELSMDRDYGNGWFRDSLKVFITMPDLEGVYLRGSGDMYIEDADSDNLVLKIGGSGDIRVSGTCGNGEMEVDGSGDIDARDLTCRDLVLRVDGSGDIRANATGTASATIRGSGDIDIYGGASLIQSVIRGSGDVETHD